MKEDIACKVLSTVAKLEVRKFRMYYAHYYSYTMKTLS